jgi:glyoxylase-like metal-dependent hydrolase (beta-lactamase superfamily II)
MSDVRTIDVRHLGRERVIAAFLVDGCLVDPGPESSLENLLAALGDERPERILLTHIHLDHAGGTGALVRRWPDLEVWVHERGAPHVHDPAKLISSASRLYGDDMERLWGEIVPVPQENLKVLTGGERIGDWTVAYTPGHASHHVSYLHEPSGTAFTGDTAGVRIPPDGPVLAPTPPPDIDLEAWPASIDTIAGWAPERLAVTHFGLWEGDVDEHLAALREQLDRQVAMAREATGVDDFAERIRAYLRERTDEQTAAAYEQGMPPDHLFPGLERALRRVTSPPA